MMKRREFLKTSAAAAGTAAFVAPQFSIGKSGPSANSKLNIAMVGNGGIAGMAYGGVRSENVVAVCDIDENRLKRGGGKTFTDYRKMYDKMGKGIDAVCVNAPDHTHFGATIEAMRRGYHVCTQKPLTHDLWQARTLLKAARKYPKLITNMGNQGHTYNGIRDMAELYQHGLLGDVTEVHCGFPGPSLGSHYFAKAPKSLPYPTQKTPDHIKWDLWVGPAPKTSYNPAYHPLKWRSFWDYGTGMLGDWFCHIGDGPVWVLDLYDAISCERIEINENIKGVIPNSCVVKWEFAKRGDKKPCTMYWYDGIKNGGTPIKKPKDWSYGGKWDKGSFFFGSKNNAYLDERSNNPRISDKTAMLEYKELKKAGKIPQKYDRVKGGSPHAEWVRAIKGGPKPGSSFEYSARLTETCLLGVLAERFGGKIEWDAKNCKVTNRKELNEFVKEPVRNGWEDYGVDLWT
ncbi:MAG: Gfo/Idh/MocA family oxidoreductase [Phycisphaerae bacterium]|jgi:hypothetical protein|nr:Gfo/Idh/MocA family oxidoreductase [Phycisphaerae bacterium]